MYHSLCGSLARGPGRAGARLKSVLQSLRASTAFLLGDTREHDLVRVLTICRAGLTKVMRGFKLKQNKPMRTNILFEVVHAALILLFPEQIQIMISYFNLASVFTVSNDPASARQPVLPVAG